MAQNTTDKERKLKKVGILYNATTEDSFLFNDPDFTFRTDVFKFQFFYDLNEPGRSWDLNLIVQPQFQVARHQLINEQFVTPDEPNFEQLRERFTQKKTISLYAFELGFQLRKKIFNQLYFEATAGLGAGYIDVETERLAQGFTFVENFSLGLAYQWSCNEVYLGGQIGHISNLDTQLPNSGFNLLGFEIGYRIYLNKKKELK